MSRLMAIQDELKALSEQQIALVATVNADGENWTEERLGEANQRKARMAELGDERKRLNDAAEIARSAQAEYEYQTQPVNGLIHPGSKGSDSGRPGAPVRERKTAGQLLTEDAAYKSWYERIAPHGIINEKMRFDSPAVEVPGGFKSLLTGLSDTSGGAFVFNDVQAGLTPLGRRPLMIRDVITIGRTTSDTVEFVRVTTETNNAAPVAEATAASGSSGVKPESALGFEKVTTPVRTIAHWVPATTRALSDAGQLRTLVDEFLRYGLEEELEDQIINGDGSGENLDGIGHISGTQSQSWDTNILTTTRKAKTKVRTVGRSRATAFLLHPNDWQTIDLLQDNEARYYYGGPAREGTPLLWGLPVVECEGCTEGVGYVGDFRTVVLWDREQASIQVSNSHSDFFIRNLVAILAEMRAALGVLKPNAIVEMDLTA